MKKNANSKTRNQAPKGCPWQKQGNRPQRDALGRNRKSVNSCRRHPPMPRASLWGEIPWIFGKTKHSKLNTQNFLLTLVLALAFSFVLPWWSVMLAAFLAGAILRLKNVAAFFVPFLATSLFWIAYAWVLSSANDFILAKKISVLFYLKGNAWLLLLLTGVIGGVSAGVAGVFGNQVRAAFSKIYE